LKSLKAITPRDCEAFRLHRRIADYTVFMNDGRVVEWGATAQIFSDPQQELTCDYLAFGG